MNADNVFGHYEMKALKNYTIQRDKQDMVHILYCDRCGDLVDISPFKSDIYASCQYHDGVHVGVGPEMSGLLTVVADWEAENRDNRPFEEMFEADFRAFRSTNWQTLIGAEASLY